ncbi:hypothetical protein BGZ93_005544 [Podila epicladia]|nr:hypothetical protein BGZ92_002967 [Podila epicladia]KAG0095708.1 hypothetical protein BGZ93_005544 [Podila epicladia]
MRIQEHNLDDRAFGFQYLDRIRMEIDEIYKILVLYSTQGKFQVDTLPAVIVCYRNKNDHRGVVKSLQKRYHKVQDQEVNLVLASKDKASISEVLIRTRILIAEIEKVLFKARPFQQLALPRCLSSCIIRGSGSSHKISVLEDRHRELTKHEFKIALANVQATAVHTECPHAACYMGNQ